MNSILKYRAVVGLAGHVDHGKTALIEVLTGIVTARPHEQALGMTQDLGFAHFSDESGNIIGVVDVPGHERYLRNMVAGVWHLNALLLVVAADEGWMPMTTAHLQVAHAMGMKAIIVCINKSDRVDASRLDEVEEDALEKVMEITDLVPEIIAVSALTGENIAPLRQLIIETLSHRLAQSDDAAPSAEPRLYVDRAFVVNGLGTIVTGTLAEGSLSIGDKVRCLPSGLLGTVRSLEAYHHAEGQVSATSRVAVNLKGVSRKQIARGHLITGVETSSTLCRQCVVRLSSSTEGLARRQREVEVAIGTWHGIGKLCYIPHSTLARVIFEHPVPLQFAERMALLQKGGSRLLHAAEVVWRDEIPVRQKRRIYSVLSDLPQCLTRQIEPRLRLELQGYFVSLQPLELEEGDGVYLEPYMVKDSWLQGVEQRILELLGEGMSMSAGELSSRLGIEEALIEIILQRCKQAQQIHLAYGKWSRGQGACEDELPSVALSLLQQARALGKAGLEPSKLKLTPADRKWLRQLVHQKLLTALEEGLYYDMGLYHQLVEAVLAGHQPQDRISMSEIKERTELSRKYSIPLANRMEKDGWVRRDGDERLILKGWDEAK